ncbi:MAG: hypothetical protein ACREAC_04500, partial [Blastocatellia bacterium]
EVLFEDFTKGISEAAVSNCPSAWEVCSQLASTTEEQLLGAGAKPFTVVLNWVVADFLPVLRPQASRIEELTAWLKQVSEPLYPPTSIDAQEISHSLVVAGDHSGLSRALRHLFPEAAWIDGQEHTAVIVLQLRRISMDDRNFPELETPTGKPTGPGIEASSAGRRLEYRTIE